MADIPAHVGLILDGNRRWAKSQGLPSLEGHRQGYFNLKKSGEYLLEQGVSYVTAYIWSSENWKRTQEEIDYIMGLVEWVLSEEVEELHAKNVKLRFLGSREGIKPQILAGIEAAEVKTASNTKGTLALCFNYGGHQEIVDAAKELIASNANLDTLTIENFSNYLYAPDIPQIDLMVRTAGEQRISGFMLWRLNYAELYFSDKLWPDFTPEDMDKALAWYAERDRRFGGDTQKTESAPQLAKELVSK
jgi:undecaprenyl diphosphate synthase